ncbi:SPOR domain-containing protein [Parvularcula maris]|uniref:SPOR domain-containing protein n=1 Tax=Parvularcula maris TaxID=2965077 RepID=A0A9X2RH57_9PROT|nr:SPOR domain-containing protein [Parvularcula maris]MCQ8184560.1 SPOR domain-containing protein [Parvularcula maris]
MSSTVAQPGSIFDDEEDGLSGFTILAILATLLMVFALVVYYAYRQGMATGIAASETLPAVVADPTPIAEDVPLTANRDGTRQEVQDLLAGNSTTRTVTEENPSRDALNGYSGAPTAARREPVRQETVAERASTASTSETTQQRQASEPPRQKPAVAAAQTPVRQDPVVRTVEQRPAVQPVQQRPAPAAAAAATHVVQVGAFDSNKAALDYFDSLGSRMGGLLSGKSPDIQVAEVKGRTYHRLRIGPFTSKSDADAYCRSLKAKGQDCLVRGV